MPRKDNLSRGIIPELYIALRNFPENVGVTCGEEVGVIEETICEMCDPLDEKSVITKYFREEDIALWEYILRHEKD